MYLPDLSYYHGWKPIRIDYRKRLDAKAKDSLLNHPLSIGWLEPHCDYTKGPTPSKEWLAKLALITLQTPLSMYCGSQGPLVGKHRPWLQANISSELSSIVEPFLISNDFPFKNGCISRGIGSGEFRISGLNKVNGKPQTYVAPSSLYHYIIDGEYLPPEEFINAVDKTVTLPQKFEYRYFRG